MIMNENDVSNVLWIAIEYRIDGHSFVGVFDTKEKAASACYNDNVGIGPAVLNMAIQEETVQWPGFYYPNLEQE